jgi:protein DEK
LSLRLRAVLLQEAAKDKAENYADGLKLKDLKTQLTMCDLELAGKKDELVERLINFLNKPEASGKKSLADKDAEKKAKAAAKKERLEKKRERNKAKREKAKKKKEKDAKKKAAAKKKKQEEAEESDDSDEEDDEEESEEEDEESEEEDEAPPKKKAKKKPAKQESESDSDDDAPIGSLNKPKVTDALLAEKVKEMAESSDFETLSLKIIRERLAETLGQDMGPYKKQIKAVVIKAIGGE